MVFIFKDDKELVEGEREEGEDGVLSESANRGGTGCFDNAISNNYNAYKKLRKKTHSHPWLSEGRKNLTAIDSNARRRMPRTT